MTMDIMMGNIQILHILYRLVQYLFRSLTRSINRNIRKKMVLLPLEIHAAKIMVEAVGDHQILGLEQKVVTGNLIKNNLVYFDFGRFTFNQNFNTPVWIEDDHIVPFF